MIGGKIVPVLFITTLGLPGQRCRFLRIELPLQGGLLRRNEHPLQKGLLRHRVPLLPNALPPPNGRHRRNERPPQSVHPLRTARPQSIAQHLKGSLAIRHSTAGSWAASNPYPFLRRKTPWL